MNYLKASPIKDYSINTKMEILTICQIPIQDSRIGTRHYLPWLLW